METAISPQRSRREGVPASPIELADGNSWWLALPATRLKPEVVEGVDHLGRPSRSIRLIAELGYPMEIRRLIADLHSACDSLDPGGQYEALIGLAAALLCRAHDIEWTAAVPLLELGLEDLPRLVEAVLSVVSGGPSIDPQLDEKG